MGKSEHRMDNNYGYPYFRKPPCIPNASNHLEDSDEPKLQFSRWWIQIESSKPNDEPSKKETLLCNYGRMRMIMVNVLVYLSKQNHPQVGFIIATAAGWLD